MSIAVMQSDQGASASTHPQSSMLNVLETKGNDIQVEFATENDVGKRASSGLGTSVTSGQVGREADNDPGAGNSGIELSVEGTIHLEERQEHGDDTPIMQNSSDQEADEHGSRSQDAQGVVGNTSTTSLESSEWHP